MKTTVALALLGLCNAIENQEGDGKNEVAVWENVEVRPEFSKRMCRDSWECQGDDMVCAQQQWEYNNQQESGVGCWHKSVCQDQSFYMFDGRKIQFWCDQQAFEKTDGKGSLVYPIWPAGEQHWKEWELTCLDHQTCRDRNGLMNQHCTEYSWMATEDGSSYSAGTACYSWDKSICDDKEASSSYPQTSAIQNVNFDRTKFSYYTELRCKGYDADFQVPDLVGKKGNPGMDERKGGDGGEFSFMDHTIRMGEGRIEMEGPAGSIVMDEDDMSITMRSDQGTTILQEGRLEMSDDNNRIIMEENPDGSSRIEIIMGATKLAATAASALIASTLY